MQWTFLLRTLGVLALVFGLVHLCLSSLDGTLYRPNFLTGWMLFALTGLPALAWWNIPTQLEPFANRARRQSWGTLLLLFGLGVHTELSLPQGFVETLLVLLVLAVYAGAQIGVSIVNGQAPVSELEERAARWVRGQTALIWSLLALGVFHAAFVHLHGAMAYFFLYGEEVAG